MPFVASAPVVSSTSLPPRPRRSPRKHGTIALLLLSTAFNPAFTSCAGQSQTEPTPTAIANPAPTRIIALGRLGPIGGVIKLSVPNAADSRVNQLLVQEGDRVAANQVIAILQGFESREQDLAEAEQTVKLYQARLDQARAGTTKQAELLAQRADISRLEAQISSERLERQAQIDSANAELREAEATYQRQQSLLNVGAISRQSFDQARRSLDSSRALVRQRQAQLATTEITLTAQIRQAKASLAQLQEVRPVDIRVAQADLDRARITVAQRRADLENTRVRVPIAGQILRINTKIGEQVNTQQGIVELGQTDQMYVLAEIYETQIRQIRLGQRAKISSEYGGFRGEVQGRVDRIGLQIASPQLQTPGNNPTTDENTRVVQVQIRIDPNDSAKVARFTNMQVRVEVELSEAIAPPPNPPSSPSRNLSPTPP